MQQNNNKAAKVAAPAIQSPSLPSHTYTREELQKNEDFLSFVASSPRFQKMGELELRWSWDAAKDNARIAANLETRTDEIKAVLDALDAQGLTIGDLLALDRVQRGQPAFGYGAPDYLLPKGYKRADLE